MTMKRRLLLYLFLGTALTEQLSNAKTTTDIMMTYFETVNDSSEEQLYLRAETSEKLARELNVNAIANGFGCKTKTGTHFLRKNIAQPLKIDPSLDGGVPSKKLENRKAIIKKLFDDEQFRTNIDTLLNTAQGAEGVIDLLFAQKGSWSIARFIQPAAYDTAPGLMKLATYSSIYLGSVDILT